MNQGPTKSDWRHFKHVRELALERLCKRILDDVAANAADSSQTYHERYLKIYKMVQDYDDDIAMGFNEFSRSRMLQQTIFLRSRDLISDDEMSGFSDGVRKSVGWALED